MRSTLSQTFTLAIAGLLGLSGVRLQAGSAFYNFDTDPAQSGLTLVGNAQWSSTGGNPSTGGYLIITPASNNQRSAILFPDIDNGALVGGFTFDADVRIGNGTSRPADGFSLNYVRASDPTLPNLANGAVNGFSDLGNGGDPDLPEEGTQTGISIGFDAWDSGTIVNPPVAPAVGQTDPSITHDYPALDVRVDNLLITEFNMLTLNGSVTDPTSIQTGPRDGTGSPDVLGWAHVHVELSTNGVLNVAYKNTVILTNFQTGFAPSPGRLVFAGRTGGANENHDIDNVLLTTVTIPNAEPVIGTVKGSPLGFSVQAYDTSVTVQTNTIVAQLNSTNVTLSTLTYSNGVTSLSFVGPPLAPGSSNSVTVSFTASDGKAVTRTQSFVVGPYNLVPATDAVTALINTNNSGFLVLPYQTSGGQNNTIAFTENQLAGFQGPNFADLSTAATNSSYSGYYIMSVVNWANTQGNVVDGFQGADSPPGITGANGPGGNGSQNNYSEEALAFLQFPAAGIYRMGVNSDDGFKVTEGPNPRDQFALNLGQFNGGRGAADTTFTFVVPQAGIYPFRLIYEQGGGGANCSWFTYAPDGTRVLINDLTNPNAIKAYYSTTRIGPTYLPPYGVGNWQVTSPLGFTLTIGDGTTAVNASSVQVHVDGQTVTPVVTHDSVKNQTLVAYTANPPFPPNSGHAVSITFADGATPPNTRTYGFFLFVPAYASIPSGYAVSSVDQTKPGFMIEPWQTALPEPNTVIWAEDQIAGLEGTNQANLTGATTGPDGQSYFYWSGPINFNITPSSAGGGDVGNFQSPAYPDVQFPGLPGTAGNGTDNSSMEVVTFVQFPASGIYRMGVNSDDGFQVTAAANPRDRAGVVLGNFNGGRGASDTIFPFYVAQAGIYPLRLIWENGTGGANCEWFMLQPDGSKVLINDSSNPNSLKAYAAGPSSGASTAAYVSYYKATAAAIVIQLQDASTTVDSTSVKLTVNGQSVTPTATKSSGLTTVNYSPAGGLAAGNYVLVLTYSDGAAQSRTFSVTVPNVVALPTSYALTTGVDTNKAGFRVGPWQTATAEPNSIAFLEQQLLGQQGPNIADLTAADALGFMTVATVVNWDRNPGSTFNGLQATDPLPGQPSPSSGAFDNDAEEVLTYLYFPSAGSYTMGVNSDDGFQVDTALNPRDRDYVVLGQFNGGRGAANTEFTFNIAKPGFYPFRLIWENGTGGASCQWYSRNPDGSRVLINDTTSPTAILAYWSGPNGDPASIPWVRSTTIVPNQMNVAITAPIQVVLADGASPLNASTLTLSLNGTKANATVTKTNGLTTVMYTPSPALPLNTVVTLSLVYSDASKTYTNAWNFTTSPLGAGTLFIEAEDFNFNHGQWLTNANLGMNGPYDVGAYQGLGSGNRGFFGDGSDYGIDFNTDHRSNPSAVYRPTTSIGTAVTGDTPSRGLFSVTNNWEVGWEDTGDWANYTRNFPNGNYQIYAALSSGGADIHAELDQVTSTANTVNQTVKKLGNFDAPTTGGWETYTLVPLRDANNQPVQLTLNGTTTLRFTVLPGNLNFDYLAFLPVGGGTNPPPTLKFTAIQASGGNLTITWTGGGTLQQSTALGGTWTPVAGASSPATVAIGSNKTLFFRVQQ